MKLSVIAMIVSAFMMLAACTETVQKQKIPGATYMGGNNTITEICKELDSAGAAHVDIFREWAVDFAVSCTIFLQILPFPESRLCTDPDGRYRQMYGWLGTES